MKVRYQLYLTLSLLISRRINTGNRKNNNCNRNNCNNQLLLYSFAKQFMKPESKIHRALPTIAVAG